MARLLITDHAVDRYRKRVRPDWDYATCSAHLHREASHARVLRDPTSLGDQRWEIADAILVVARGHEPGRPLVVKTVLPKDEPRQELPDWLQAEVDAAIGTGGGDGR